MKIQKFNHCCMLIEESGLRILVDPGMFSVAEHSALENIDVVLITHEHADHFHVDSLKTVLEKNPNAVVFTIRVVADLMKEKGMTATLLEDGGKETVKGVVFEAFGKTHAPLHPSMPVMFNTGYFIADRFFFPGDALTNPGKQMEILALPVAGPWLKMSEVIDYALALKPKIAIPVHDGLMANPTMFHPYFKQFLSPQGITVESIDGKGLMEF